MVTLGVDSHKRTHTAVAVNGNGRQLASKTVAATSDGDRELLKWSRQWPKRQWAVEDCRHVSRRLESDLLSGGEAVLRVPPKLMAGARTSTRERGKSDAIDALVVARLVLREDKPLPVAQLAGESLEVKQLVDHREDLVKRRTEVQNQLRWDLHQMDPKFVVKPGSLDRKVTVERVAAFLAEEAGSKARSARRRLNEIRQLTAHIHELEAELEPLVRKLGADLLKIPGCKVLTAGKLIGEVGGVDRFRSPAAFARYNGTAPIPVFSGQENSKVVRLNRGGNRQVNAALHRIAVTQIRLGSGESRQYYERKLSQGKTKRSALRALKRRLSDKVYWLMKFHGESRLAA